MGYFVTEIGSLNQVVHMWAYESLADREAKRTALEQDPAWTEYRKESTSLGLNVAQENKILKASSISTWLSAFA